MEGLPPRLPEPLTVCQICAANQPPCWQEDEMCRNEPRAIILLVQIPLEVVVRDGVGCLHRGRSEILMRVRVALCCPRGECWQNQWVLLPSVRMNGCADYCGDATFCVKLEACLEAYLVRQEAVFRQECRPMCPPPLPLYPHPARIEDCCTY